MLLLGQISVVQIIKVTYWTKTQIKINYHSNHYKCDGDRLQPTVHNYIIVVNGIDDWHCMRDSHFSCADALPKLP